MAQDQKSSGPQSKTSASIPPASEFIYQANLEVMGEQAKNVLQTFPERPIAIDPNIVVQGLKNPLTLVIIGFSTRLVLESVKKMGKTIDHVVIIEPDASVFHQTLKRELISDLQRSDSVDLVIGIKPEELVPHLYAIFTRLDKKHGSRAGRCMTPEIISDPFVYPPKDGKNDPTADAVTKAVMDSVKQVFLSMGCSSDSHFRWEQLFRNRKNLQNSYRIEPLFNKFQDTPVIVLGAGPSLKDFIDYELTHKVSQKALVIACDAALPKLLNLGIKPHIVTRCERKLTTIFTGVTKEKTEGIYYASYPWCSPEYFDLFDRSFMLFRDNGLCLWSGYNPGSVNGGVSSANAGLELAYLLGAKEIVLSGVDLCFIDNKSHVEGTEVEFDVDKSKPKWTTIPGNNGEPVTTIPVWYRCLNEYKGTIFKHGGKATVFNTSLNGAKIDGTRITPWVELDTMFKSSVDPSKTIEKYLEKHTQAYEDTFKKTCYDTSQVLKSARHDLTKLFLNIEDALITAKREEEKVFSQVRAIVDPADFNKNLKTIQESLAKVYEEPSRQIDQFKSKWYNVEKFSKTVIDICQLDYFTTENKGASLKNSGSLAYEIHKQYIGLHLMFFKTLYYYSIKLIDLLDNGPNEFVDYSCLRAEFP